MNRAVAELYKPSKKNNIKDLANDSGPIHIFLISRVLCFSVSCIFLAKNIFYEILYTFYRTVIKWLVISLHCYLTIFFLLWFTKRISGLRIFILSQCLFSFSSGFANHFFVNFSIDYSCTNLSFSLQFSKQIKSS